MKEVTKSMQEPTHETAVEVVEVDEVEEVVEVSPEEAEEAVYKANAFTPQEAALELGGTAAGWTGKRLRRYIRSGDCPARKIGGRWFVTVENLEDLLGVLEKRSVAKAAKEAEEVAKRLAEAEVAEAVPDPIPEPGPDDPF
jgi:hypothetical protein